MAKHTISMLVEDEPGVMTRVAGLFARRGFNIDTITVGKTHHKRISKIVITVKGDDRVVEQIEKQVNKLVDVFRISELSEEDSVIKELCLVKVTLANAKATPTQLSLYARFPTAWAWSVFFLCIHRLSIKSKWSHGAECAAQKSTTCVNLEEKLPG